MNIDPESQSGGRPGIDSLICDYRSPARKMGLIMAGFGASFCTMAILKLVHASAQPPAALPFEYVPFLLLGLLMLGGSVYCLAVGGRESITILNRTITWRDGKGVVRVSCSFDDVEPGSFQRFLSSRYSNAYIVETTHGPIRWNMQISYFDELNAIMSGLSTRAD